MGGICKWAGVIVALLCAVAAAGTSSADAQSPACPQAPPAGALPDAAALARDNAFVGRLGVRPTGSQAQERYIDWIRKQMRSIPGVKLDELRFPIKRWSASQVDLRMRAGGHELRLPVADAIPYAKPTGPNGVSAPLAAVPSDQAISSDNSKGKIVVREAPAGSVPQAAFLAVTWGLYDPGLTIDPTKNFFGDFINYNARVADLRNAAAAGAKGILFVKDLPRKQLIDHYEPYEGTAWDVPGMFLGADEGKQVSDAMSADPRATAQLTIRARFDPVVTPSVLATIPGRSPQRVVIDSHTDGTNAVEDNGPVAMVAMARYFASLPIDCRPRTVQFAFSTAHFYQRVADPAVRDGGAEQLAKRLDADYDKGTVSSVLVLEHLGAREYAPVPRQNGPGSELKLTGRREIQFAAVTPSAPLVAAVHDVVRRHDMQRTILLRGSDAPGDHDPMHCSFGGEGTPYNNHLLPTVGVIAAPQTLYDPAFGVEGIDFGVMHDELLGFTELALRLQTMSQTDVAGAVTAERAQRAAGAGPPCPQAN